VKVIEDENLAHAWARGVRVALDRRGEVAPLVLSVSSPFDGGVPPADPVLETKLDALLRTENAKLSIDTVANTLFPQSLWNADRPRKEFYNRFLRLWPRIQKSNPYGHYFHRLITLGDPEMCDGNQLEFIIDSYTARQGVRRSMLQATTFDAKSDHTRAALRGFPCLQQVSFAVQSDRTISVNGFYAFQYIGKRAYGNYVGLCRLGHFVAHELGTRLSRMTCYAGIAQCDIGATKLRNVLSHLNEDIFEGDKDEV
jgi:hypothetical protein